MHGGARRAADRRRDRALLLVRRPAADSWRAPGVGHSAGHGAGDPEGQPPGGMWAPPSLRTRPRDVAPFAGYQPGHVAGELVVQRWALGWATSGAPRLAGSASPVAPRLPGRQARRHVRRDRPRRLVSRLQSQRGRAHDRGRTRRDPRRRRAAPHHRGSAPRRTTRATLTAARAGPPRRRLVGALAARRAALRGAPARPGSARGDAPGLARR